MRSIRIGAALTAGFIVLASNVHWGWMNEFLACLSALTAAAIVDCLIETASAEDLVRPIAWACVLLALVCFVAIYVPW